MTWSARIFKADGTIEPNQYNACQSCKHQQTCYLPKVTSGIGSILTSVDTGSDGYMANGNAELRCNGYEAEVVPEG